MKHHLVKHPSIWRMMQKKKRRFHRKRRWTREEEDYLKKHYLTDKTTAEISIYLGRTHKAVTERARTLGLSWYPKALDKNKLIALNKKLDGRFKGE